MAVRMTKSGLQSYDPNEELKKKLLLNDDGTVTTPPVNQTPIIPPVINTLPPIDISTEAGRFAAAGVAPYQPGMTADISQGIKNAYEAQKSPLQIALENQKAKIVENATNQYLQEQFLKNPYLRGTQDQTTTDLTSQTQTNLIDSMNPVSTPENYVSPNSLSQKITDVLRPGAGPQLKPGVAIEQMGTNVIQGAAEIIDGIASVLLSKKSAKVTSADAALTDALQIINTDIELARKGLKPVYLVKKDFNNARISMNNLERTNHGIGKLNLRYWLGGGKETEMRIMQAQQLLDGMNLELDQISQQQLLSGVGL